MVLKGSNILSLDVGERRIGVAIACTIARLPRPYSTLERSQSSMQQIADLLKQEDAQHLVIGLPRSLSGGETEQTKLTRKFAAELQAVAAISVHFQDEALTSVQAEKELTDKGVKFVKGDIDALAATYILQDFLTENRN